MHERLTGLMADATRPIRASRGGKRAIVVTEKGWASPKVANDSAHEWAYIQTVSIPEVDTVSIPEVDTVSVPAADFTQEPQKIFECMHCKTRKLASASNVAYVVPGDSTKWRDCPPCPAKVHDR